VTAAAPSAPNTPAEHVGEHGEPEASTVDDRITLRFMAVPQDVTASGTVAAGSVLEWIDKAGYACAVGWSASYCVTAYVGNVHFTRPIQSGNLVEVHARIIHTGRSSMHVLVTVETTDVRERAYSRATDCIIVFVAVDDAGHPRDVPVWQPRSDADRTLQGLAQSRVEPRKRIQAAMRTEEYSAAGTTPRTVFRFLAAPADANWGGKAHGGTVMRWIDEAAYACAASWSSESAVAVYSGGIHFYRPIQIGHIVEVDARLIHTGTRSMHISVHVRSGSPRTPHDLQLTTQCMSIFVAPGPNGHAAPVPALPLVSAEDKSLDALAQALIGMRADLEAIPLDLARRP
jgi:acyl-CoA hydrolase